MRRRLLSAVAWLSAGAIVTVVVAWWCALRMPPVAATDPVAGDWPAAVPSDWPPPRNSGEARRFGVTATVWSATRDEQASYHEDVTLAITFGVMRLSSGWPFRAVDATLFFTDWPGDPLMMEWEDAWPLPRRFQGVAGDGSVLPRRIRPAGLIADVAFFAVLGASIGWLIGRARRRRRVRRGLCPSCRYARAGVSGACPECGADWSDLPPVAAS